MFTQARLKLTLFYTIIITLVLVVFSFVLFNVTVQHIHDTTEEDSSNAALQRRIVDHTIDQFQNNIIRIDGIVILLVGFMSYFLAGWTLKPIQAALDAQEQFSAHASHELRTPLAVMKSENEVFLKNSKASLLDGRSLATSNLEEINRMTGMIEGLLVLARSKKADVTVEMSDVNLSKLIEQTVHKLKISAEIKNIELRSVITPDLHIKGNVRLLEHVFFNVIQNAINYTKIGSITIQTSQVKNNMIHIDVIDTGIGIDKKDIHNVFKSFYKVDQSRMISPGGVGLGLSIVQEIVHKHNGSIKLESEINKGTTITLIFASYKKILS